MVLETLITLFIAVLIIGAVWLIYGRNVKPIKANKGEKLYTLVSARGSTPGLGHTVDGILWLLNSGRIDMEIIIADGGMDEESRKMAEIIARSYDGVSLCNTSELGGLLAGETEEECRKRGSTI